MGMSVDGPRQHITGSNNTQVGGDLNLVVPKSHALPTSVVKVILKLDEVLDQPNFPRGNNCDPSDIAEKLTYNDVTAFRQFIEEYGSYGYAVEGAYSALQNSDPQIASRVSRYVRSLYIDIAAETPRPGSDAILRRLVDTLRERVGAVADVPAEQVDPCCSMLVAHAFVNCRVLERVPVRVDR